MHFLWFFVGILVGGGVVVVLLFWGSKRTEQEIDRRISDLL
jgi:hypothetical protein